MHSRQRAEAQGSLSVVCACSLKTSGWLWCVLPAKLWLEDASALKLVQLPGEAPRASSCWPPGLPAPLLLPLSSGGARRSLVIPHPHPSEDRALREGGDSEARGLAVRLLPRRWRTPCRSTVGSSGASCLEQTREIAPPGRLRCDQGCALGPRSRVPHPSRLHPPQTPLLRRQPAAVAAS